jgi:small subunit ribosomal protein S17
MSEETEKTEQPTPDSQPAAPAEIEEPTGEGESAASAAEGTDTEASSDPTPEAPAAEETPAAEAEAPAEEAPAPPAQSQPKKKRKHLPRALRPTKGRRVHVPAAERKPIVRLPKPEHDRGRSQERRGVVVSSAMDKTIVVKVDVIKQHPRYKKVVRRSVKFHAHDEQNSANVGDVVRIVETRPLSATKRWRLAEIVEAAK